LELQLRTSQITLGAVESLLVYQAISSYPDASVTDLHYEDGPKAGEPKTGDDLPAWYKAAGSDASNLTFRRLAAIRAQVVAGETLGDTEKGDGLQAAEAAIDAQRKALEKTLDSATKLLEKLVRWSRALKDEQRALRDQLLLKARQSQKSLG